MWCVLYTFLWQLCLIKKTTNFGGCNPRLGRTTYMSIFLMLVFFLCFYLRLILQILWCCIVGSFVLLLYVAQVLLYRWLIHTCLSYLYTAFIGVKGWLGYVSGLYHYRVNCFVCWSSQSAICNWWSGYAFEKVKNVDWGSHL